MSFPEMLNRRKKKTDRWTIVTVVVLFVLILIAVGEYVILSRYIVVEVVGSSMADTLHTEDVLYAEKNRKPKRGDIVIADVGESNEHIIIKRVIAVEGDRIKCENGVVYLAQGDGEYEEIDESYVKGRNTIDFEYTIGENSFFLMGDNREISKDSREIGQVKEDNILGVVPKWAVQYKELIGGWEGFRSFFANIIR